ncbi:MAG: serine/threonine-protein kinase [Isosphaeraceae bacterium]
MTTLDEEVTLAWRGRDGGGRVSEPSSGFRAGDVIDGRYRVARSIGRGGMGSVVEVEDLTDGVAYALKYCRLEGPWRKRFAREVRLMRRVRHPHVVPVLGANLEADPPYFVMPLALGSLEEELGRLAGNEDEALSVFRKVCLGVRAIHDRGIVHRDVKPANVLRLANGQVVVSDLGIAKLETRDSTVLTQTRAVVGTLAYLAPEQFLPDGSRRADVRTDVYQLGKLLYRLLTGRSPALIEPGAVPKGLAHILSRATCVNPDDRYRNLDELLDALRYYALSRDPGRNAREALESLVTQAEALLKRREYRADLVREILALLAPLGRLEPPAAIERFDRLPDGLLPVLAWDFAGEFVPVVRAYGDAIRARVAGFPFSYADQLARRMRLIFEAADRPALKVEALRALLIAAVELHRFAAMHVFNRLLAAARSVEDALPIAEMLRAHDGHYAMIADGVSADRLHPAIREVRLELLAPADSRG